MRRSEARATGTYRPERFPRLPTPRRQGGRLADRTPSQRASRGSAGEISQSERDWAYARGGPWRAANLQIKVRTAIAAFRVGQKADVNQYAERAQCGRRCSLSNQIGLMLIGTRDSDAALSRMHASQVDRATACSDAVGKIRTTNVRHLISSICPFQQSCSRRSWDLGVDRGRIITGMTAHLEFENCIDRVRSDTRCHLGPRMAWRYLLCAAEPKGTPADRASMESNLTPSRSWWWLWDRAFCWRRKRPSSK